MVVITIIFFLFSQTPSDAEIQAYRRGLLAQAEAWLAAQEQMLLAQITAREAQYKAQIEQWVSKMKAYVLRVKAQFKCCQDNRTAKVDAYKLCLTQKIASRKAQLKTRLEAVS